MRTAYARCEGGGPVCVSTSGRAVQCAVHINNRQHVYVYAYVRTVLTLRLTSEAAL